MGAGKNQREVKVLHIMSDERLGGPQLRMLQLAEPLRENGFINIVVTPEGDKAFANLLDDANILHYQIKNYKRLPSSLNPFIVLGWFFYFIPSIVSLAKLIRKNRIDVVHVYGFLELREALAAKIGGAKLLWHLCETLTPKPLKTLLMPFFYLLPDKVASNAKSIETYYLKKGSKPAKDVSILYEPVDTGKFYPDHNRMEEYRREFGLKLEDRVVGIVGNINRAKGYEYFVSAAGMIKEVFPDVKFLVVGARLKTKEKYWQKLQALIADLGIEKDLIMTGFRMDTPQMINSMDIFVLSSVTEGLPLVILEAMACGKPVVATDVAGVSEVIVDGESGIVVPIRDSKAIAEAVLYLLHHPEEAKEMGLKGRERTLEQFDLKMIAQRQEKAYKDALIPYKQRYMDTYSEKSLNRMKTRE